MDVQRIQRRSNSPRISTSVSAFVFQKLVTLSSKQGRSLSNLVAFILEQHIHNTPHHETNDWQRCSSPDVCFDFIAHCLRCIRYRTSAHTWIHCTRKQTMTQQPFSTDNTSQASYFKDAYLHLSEHDDTHSRYWCDENRDEYTDALYGVV